MTEEQKVVEQYEFMAEDACVVLKKVCEDFSRIYELKPGSPERKALEALDAAHSAMLDAAHALSAAYVALGVAEKEKRRYWAAFGKACRDAVKKAEAAE